MTYPQNQKYTTYHNGSRRGPRDSKWQHAKNLVKIGCVVFELCDWIQAERQTDKQTYSPEASILMGQEDMPPNIYEGGHPW